MIQRNLRELFDGLIKYLIICFLLQIERDKIKGCNLFDICHKYTLCGESSIENAFKRYVKNF